MVYSILSQVNGGQLPNDIDDDMALQLYDRGLVKYDSKNKRFSRNIDTGSDLEGLDEVINRFKDYVIGGGKKFTIMSDYDNDGITAEVLLNYNIQQHIDNSADISVYHPTRAQGFGELGNLRDKLTGGSLLFVTDTGSEKLEELSELADANKLAGVIVGDHHIYDVDRIPDNVTLVNPAKGTVSGRDIAAHHTPYSAGGIQAIFAEKLGISDINTKVLGAISTLGDQVPLIGDNVRLVEEGLSVIHDRYQELMPGLKSLVEKTIPYQRTAADITTTDILFKMVPMINAMSRMEYHPEFKKMFGEETSGADVVSQLLRTGQINDLSGKTHGIEILQKFNEIRKSVTNELMGHVSGHIDQMKSDMGEEAWNKLSGLVIADTDIRDKTGEIIKIPSSIAGLLSADITNRYGKNNIVLSRQEDGTYKGSGRAVEGYDIFEQFKETGKSIEISGGGHEGAIGMSRLSADKLEAFRDTFQTAPTYKDHNFKKIEPWKIDVADITPEFLARVKAFEQYAGPTGAGNPPLQFQGKMSLSDIRKSKTSPAIFGMTKSGLKDPLKVNFFRGAPYEGYLKENSNNITSVFSIRQYSGGDVELNIEGIPGVNLFDTEKESTQEDVEKEYTDSGDFVEEVQEDTDIPRKEYKLKTRGKGELTDIYNKYRKNFVTNIGSITGLEFSDNSAAGRILEDIAGLEGKPGNNITLGNLRRKYWSNLSDDLRSWTFQDVRDLKKDIRKGNASDEVVKDMNIYDALVKKREEAYSNTLKSLMKETGQYGFEYDTSTARKRSGYTPGDTGNQTSEWRYNETMRQLQDYQYENIAEVVENISKKLSVPPEGLSLKQQYNNLMKKVPDYVKKWHPELYTEISEKDPNFNFEGILSAKDEEKWLEQQKEFLGQDLQALTLYQDQDFYSELQNQSSWSTKQKLKRAREKTVQARTPRDMLIALQESGFAPHLEDAFLSLDSKDIANEYLQSLPEQRKHTEIFGAPYEPYEKTSMKNWHRYLRKKIQKYEDNNPEEELARLKDAAKEAGIDISDLDQVRGKDAQIRYLKLLTATQDDFNKSVTYVQDMESEQKRDIYLNREAWGAEDNPLSVEDKAAGKKPSRRLTNVKYYAPDKDSSGKYFRLQDLIPGQYGDISEYQTHVTGYTRKENPIASAISFTEFMNDDKLGGARRSLWGFQEYQAQGEHGTEKTFHRLKGTRKIGDTIFTEDMLREISGLTNSSDMETLLETAKSKIAMNMSRDDFTRYRNMTKDDTKKLSNEDKIYRNSIWGLNWRTEEYKDKGGETRTRLVSDSAKSLLIGDKREWFRKGIDDDVIVDVINSSGINVAGTEISNAKTFEEKISAADKLLKEAWTTKKVSEERQSLAEMELSEWRKSLFYPEGIEKDSEEWKKISHNRFVWGFQAVQNKIGGGEHYEPTDAVEFGGEWYRSNNANDLAAKKSMEEGAISEIDRIKGIFPEGFSSKFLENEKISISDRLRLARLAERKWFKIFNAAKQSYNDLPYEEFRKNWGDETNGWIYRQAYYQAAAENKDNPLGRYQIQEYGAEKTPFRASIDADKIAEWRVGYRNSWKNKSWADWKAAHDYNPNGSNFEDYKKTDEYKKITQNRLLWGLEALPSSDGSKARLHLVGVTRFADEIYRNDVAEDQQLLTAAQESVRQENEKIISELRTKKIRLEDTGVLAIEDILEKNKKLKQIQKKKSGIRETIKDTQKNGAAQDFEELQNIVKDTIGDITEDMTQAGKKVVSDIKDAGLNFLYGEKEESPATPPPKSMTRRRSFSSLGPKLAQHAPPLLGFIGTMGAVTLFDAAFSKPKDDWGYYKQQRQQQGKQPLGYLW